MKGRIVLAILYVVAAVAVANWIDITYIAFLEPYGNRLRTVEILALVGSALFGVGSLVSLFSGRCGLVVGLTASGFSWTYFAPAAVTAPIGNFVWRFHGGAMPIAVLILLAATIYSLTRMKALLKQVAQS
jgi:hypothetical protein